MQKRETCFHKYNIPLIIYLFKKITLLSIILRGLLIIRERKPRKNVTLLFRSARRNMAVRAFQPLAFRERQIMNEHPCARAPPQPLHFLPTLCRPRRTFPRPPPPAPSPPDSTPDVNRWALADATDTTWHVLGPDTSIVLVILMILDSARYAHPIEPTIASFATEQARISNPSKDLKTEGIIFL